MRSGVGLEAVTEEPGQTARKAAGRFPSLPSEHERRARARAAPVQGIRGMPSRRRGSRSRGRQYAERDPRSRCLPKRDREQAEERRAGQAPGRREQARAKGLGAPLCRAGPARPRSWPATAMAATVAPFPGFFRTRCRSRTGGICSTIAARPSWPRSVVRCPICPRSLPITGRVSRSASAWDAKR